MGRNDADGQDLGQEEDRDPGASRADPPSGGDAGAEGESRQAGEGHHHRVGPRQGSRALRHPHHPGGDPEDTGPLCGRGNLRKGQGLDRRQGQEDTEGPSLYAGNGGRLLRRAPGGGSFRGYDRGEVCPGSLPVQTGEDQGKGAGQEAPELPWTSSIPAWGRPRS